MTRYIVQTLNYGLAVAKEGNGIILTLLHVLKRILVLLFDGQDAFSLLINLLGFRLLYENVADMWL